MTRLSFYSVMLGICCVGCKSWHVDRGAGRSCVIEKGWKRDAVVAACGQPSGSGWQPKVLSVRGLTPDACSAPGDIYGAQVVLYDCSGDVWSVRSLPMEGFVGPPSVADLVKLLKYEYQRETAIRELGRMGSAAKEAIPPLRALANDENERVRTSATAALRAIEGGATGPQS